MLVVDVRAHGHGIIARPTRHAEHAPRILELVRAHHPDIEIVVRTDGEWRTQILRSRQHHSFDARRRAHSQGEVRSMLLPKTAVASKACQRFALQSSEASHGLSVSTPVGAKSATFRVTTHMP